MMTGKAEIRRAAWWGAILVLSLAPLVLSAQEKVPVDGGEAGDAQAAPEDPPNPNPTGQLIVPRHHQSPTRQRADEWTCYGRACEQTDWDPYEAYADLVAEGYAVSLTRDDLEGGLILRAADGAMVGSVAGELVGDPEAGEEIGAAVAIASEVLRSQFLVGEDDPEARRTIERFERKLGTWERKFAACLRPKGYQVTSP